MGPQRSDRESWQLVLLVIVFVMEAHLQAFAGAPELIFQGSTPATGNNWTLNLIGLDIPQGQTCTNTAPPGAVDLGCDPILNACDNSGACVDCQSDADCSFEGDVCNVVTNSCTACLDSGPGAQDTGCGDAIFNTCINGGTASAQCVDCVVDSDCSTGLTCEVETHTCFEINPIFWDGFETLGPPG